MEKTSLEKALQAIAIERDAINNLLTYIEPESFGQAVDKLRDCQKIITCACGTSGVAAQKFAHMLCCIERDALFLSPAMAVHGGLGCIKEDDVVVLISKGGKTAELLPIIDVVNQKQACLIAVTENKASYLAQKSDIVLTYKTVRECDRFDALATASFATVVALFDALVIAIMEDMDYQAEQFALIHPGGAVGEKLNK